VSDSEFGVKLTPIDSPDTIWLHHYEVHGVPLVAIKNERVTEDDVEYIRADLYKQLVGRMVFYFRQINRTIEAATIDLQQVGEGEVDGD
jgi:hypothetical protein